MHRSIATPMASVVRLLCALSLLVVVSPPLHGQTPDSPTEITQVADVVLQADLPSGQPVGTTIVWTLTPTTDDPFTYRLLASREGEEPRVIYDYGRSQRFEWTPLEEGTYTVLGVAKHRTEGTTQADAQSFTITPRVTDQAQVSATAHPLVALYSAPPCPQGHSLRVWFTPRETYQFSSTDARACDGVNSVNLYIGGMRAETEYLLRHEVLNELGEPVSHSRRLEHTTGTPSVDFPARSVVTSTRTSHSSESVFLMSLVFGALNLSDAPALPQATDREGNVIWYYDKQIIGDVRDLYGPGPGGTFFVSESNEEEQILRQVDLAGNVVRQTNARRLSEQLLLLGHNPVTAFHHDAVRLPDGRSAFLGHVEKYVTVPGQGLTHVLGDVIVVVDEDWQVEWVWDSFDHLDINRTAILAETCFSLQPGCPPLFFGALAQDWTHSNAITYSPADGNLLLSIRHQDWVIKIDYRDGAGDGDVVWRLGPGGDFSLENADGETYPWFSHQHHPQFVADDTIIIYDNGNIRCQDENTPDPCHSRGQVYRLDESTMTATRTLNADLDNYSFAMGSSHPLSNGNSHFGSGVQPAGGGQFFATADEVAPDGTIVHSLRTDALVYRSFQMQDLYTLPGQDKPRDLDYLERIFADEVPLYLPAVAAD